MMIFAVGIGLARLATPSEQPFAVGSRRAARGWRP